MQKANAESNAMKFGQVAAIVTAGAPLCLMDNPWLHSVINNCCLLASQTDNLISGADCLYGATTVREYLIGINDKLDLMIKHDSAAKLSGIFDMVGSFQARECFDAYSSDAQCFQLFWALGLYQSFFVNFLVTCQNLNLNATLSVFNTPLCP